MFAQAETREERGFNIFELGKDKRLSESEYLVASESGKGSYRISRIEAKWVCECLDHKTREVSCKHIYATVFSITLREKASSQNFTPEIPTETLFPTTCPKCASKKFNKWGFRYQANGTRKQRYKCQACRHKWDIRNEAFAQMRVNPKAILVSLDLYFKGISLRKIQDHLKQFEGTNISFVSIYKWIRKYVALMEEYARTLEPKLSGVWHADEMKMNIHGKWHWLWNIMDSDTRYILASHVAQGRGASDAQDALLIAKTNSNHEKEPSFLNGWLSVIPSSREPRVQKYRSFRGRGYSWRSQQQPNRTPTRNRPRKKQGHASNQEIRLASD